MRQALIVVAASLLSAACGVPEVELPEGNEALTTKAPPEKQVAKPVLKDVPEKYPLRQLPLRGFAPDAAAVIVRGAGNPLLVPVNQQTFDFCVLVDMPASPAEYTLQIQGQSPSGVLSEVAEVSVVRSADAPTPSNLKNCDGDPF